MKKGWLTEKEYSKVFSRVPRVAVDLVIQSQDGVLLSLRTIAPSKGLWHLPGGRVNFRESLFSAAKRIAKEELGIAVKPIKILGTMEFLREVKEGERRHTVSTAIEVKALSKTMKTNWQSSEVRYFKKLPLNVVVTQKNFLEEFVL